MKIQLYPDTVHPEVDFADEIEPENSQPQVPRRCNTLIPQVQGRYDDVICRVEIPSRTYAKPQYRI